MHLIFMCVLSICLIILFVLVLKREKMKDAAIREIPKILSDGKLSAVEIRRRLFTSGVNVSTDTLYYALGILEESKSINCVVEPLFSGVNIISHGTYEIDTVTNHTS